MAAELEKGKTFEAGLYLFLEKLFDLGIKLPFNFTRMNGQWIDGSFKLSV